MLNDYSKLSKGIQAVYPAADVFKCGTMALGQGLALISWIEIQTDLVFLKETIGGWALGGPAHFYGVLNKSHSTLTKTEDNTIFSLKRDLGIDLDLYVLAGNCGHNLVANAISELEALETFQKTPLPVKQPAHPVAFFYGRKIVPLDIDFSMVPQGTIQKQKEADWKKLGLCTVCGDKGDFRNLSCVCRNGHGVIF